MTNTKISLGHFGSDTAMEEFFHMQQTAGILHGHLKYVTSRNNLFPTISQSKRCTVSKVTCHLAANITETPKATRHICWTYIYLLSACSAINNNNDDDDDDEVSMYLKHLTLTIIQS
jgi:hypothetical protein